MLKTARAKVANHQLPVVGQSQSDAVRVKLAEALALAERWSKSDASDHDDAREVIEGIHSVLELLPSNQAISNEAVEFGKKLRRQRDALGWSRVKLGKIANIAENTIKNIENGYTEPSDKVLRALIGVKELQLNACDIPNRNLQTASNVFRCWLTPNYRSKELIDELVEQINGPGGIIEQTYAYVDPASAAKWYDLANNPQYVVNYRRLMPLDQVAKIIYPSGRQSLDIIALGSGDGRQEVEFVQHLVAGKAEPDIQLYLVDISHTLLADANAYAKETLKQCDGVEVYAVQGDFLHLSRLKELHYNPDKQHRYRIIAMLGYTMSNLQDELRFFSRSLTGFVKGDYLLMDALEGYGDLSKPEEIKANDPLLLKGLTPEHVEWLTKAFRQYCHGFIDIQLQIVLDCNCIVPGSYAREVIARVKTQEGEKQFSVFRFKRYDIPKLRTAVQELGWDCVASTRFAEKSYLLLFRKN